MRRKNFLSPKFLGVVCGDGPSRFVSGTQEKSAGCLIREIQEDVTAPTTLEKTYDDLCNLF